MITKVFRHEPPYQANDHSNLNIVYFLQLSSICSIIPKSISSCLLLSKNKHRKKLVSIKEVVFGDGNSKISYPHDKLQKSKQHSANVNEKVTQMVKPDDQ